MQIIFECLLANVAIDEKDGGYKIVLSVPENERAAVGNLIACGKMVFYCALVNDALDKGGAGPLPEYDI